ncbi:26S proteasome non-ATPase regulatory subunit 4 [Coccomyxa sp. Obi]|nr:26S proteasome non-ATPase regulatory subunit 4 [Coccomyxa sp. Obi]
MEATVVCIDNSEWTRNGDYAPTRFQAQADAVNLLAGAKTEANPENTVGVLTMAGKSPRVLVTPTPDLGKILNSMQNLDIEGQANLSSAVQIAQLALKHRQNKNQRQRIVIFIGSPIAEDKEKLVKVAKKLKKNNVAVDVVAFGSEETNGDKLENFIGAVNSGDNSHLITVPAGTILSDMLFGSPIFQIDGGAGYGAAPGGDAAAGGDAFEFGVDPNMDPELAMALRVSMQEERARQEAATAAAAAADGTAGEAGPSAAPAGEGDKVTAAPAAVDEATPMDEDALLQQALAMSMQVDSAGGLENAATSAAPSAAAPSASSGVDVGMFDTEDEDLRLALQMSMAGDGAEAGKEKQGAVTDVLNDTDYVNSLLGSLPGVDPNDPALQGALASLTKSTDNKEEEEKEEGKDGK